MITIRFTTCPHSRSLHQSSQAGEHKVQHLFSTSKPLFSPQSFSLLTYPQNLSQHLPVVLISPLLQVFCSASQCLQWEKMILRQKYILSSTEIFLLSSNRSKQKFKWAHEHHTEIYHCIWLAHILVSPASERGNKEYFGNSLWNTLQLALFIPHISGVYLINYTWMFLTPFNLSLSIFQMYTLKREPP